MTVQKSNRGIGKFISKKALLVAAIISVGALSLLAVLEYTNIINLYDKTPQPADDTAKTTSTTETAQEEFSNGDFREPGGSLEENSGTASVADNQGVSDAASSGGDFVVSSTGEIKSYSPKANSLVKTGFTVSGESSLKKVSFRLIDSVSGVIANGELEVVNGKFSGTISYNTSAPEGRIDLFGTKSDLSEYSNVEIPIRFGR